MNYKNQKVVVLGLARTGLSTARVLKKMGAKVYGIDQKEQIDTDDLFDALLLGKQEETAYRTFIHEASLAVVSPGVPPDALPYQVLVQEKCPIWSEMEFAYRIHPGPFVVVTGTNGKTTTTSLIGTLFDVAGVPSEIVGNIGRPISEQAFHHQDHTMIAEISSFQMEQVDKFKANIGVLLNITPDHLDRHQTMSCYEALKRRAVENADKVVLNYSLAHLAPYMLGDVTFFSLTHPCVGVYAVEGDIYYKDSENSVPEKIAKLEECQLIGQHNHENILAAVLAAKLYGIKNQPIQEGLRKFKAVPHRLQYLATQQGVLFYNDSKGTNPDATIVAIRSFTTPLHMIMGGYEKYSDFSKLWKEMEGKVASIALIGQTASRIYQEVLQQGIQNVKCCDTMMEAVNHCATHAKAGDVVLLSPASASWGMYRNFEERGKDFIDCVKKRQKI